MNWKFSILVEKFGNEMRSRKEKKEKKESPNSDESTVKEIKTKDGYFGW